MTLYPQKYVFVKDGSTFRCDRSNLDGTNTTNLSANTDALTVWNAAKTDASTTEAHFHFRNGIYDFASPGATITAGRYVITGESIYGTTLKPQGNFPALKIIDTIGVTLSNLELLVDQGATYTSSALMIQANGVSRQHYNLDMLAIEHSTGGGATLQQFGNCLEVSLIGASPAISWLDARYIITRGFNNAIYVDSSTATGLPWTNENSFHRFTNSHAFTFCKTNQSSGHVSDAWQFNHCAWQTTNINATTGHMFDVDDSGTHRHWALDRCFAWDFFNNTHKLLKVNANSQFALSNCVPTYSGFLGTGSGWKNGALVNVWDQTSERVGKATFSATGIQRDFAIAPLNYFLEMEDCDIIVTAGSTDAIGEFGILSQFGSTFTVRYKRPPRAGTNNVVLNYYCRRKTVST